LNDAEIIYKGKLIVLRSGTDVQITTAKQQADTVSNSYHSFEGVVKFSAYQPIDIKPLYGRKWVTNGVNNVNFKTYKDAYDDSPTNEYYQCFVNYVYGED
jgi:hypothetical protein